MAVNDSVGRGDFIAGKTASTTSSIVPGRFVEYNSNGSFVLPTSTPDEDLIAGVAATKVATRTTDSEEDLIVQRSGLAHVACTANSAFTAGYLVRVASAGEASTAALATTITATALAKCVGKVETIDATTAGTTVVVRLL